jgi:uncharacterized protein YjiK
LAQYSLQAGSMEQWRLPEKLNEISGLALDADERLFAVADEAAVIFELDVDAGRIRKKFAFGDPVLRGDFDGIAIVDRRIYIITSDGDMISGRETTDGGYVPYDRHETGLGSECEIEGLAQDLRRRQLLIACKQIRRGRDQRLQRIFAWSVDEQALLPGAAVSLPLREIVRKLRTDRLNPSGLAVDDTSGHLLLIAARQHAIIELSREGALIDALVLPLVARHRQPEGIEIMQNGRLIIADEGGSHKARLAIYFRDKAMDAPPR